MIRTAMDIVIARKNAQILSANTWKALKMENKPIFKNYTEVEMDLIASRLNEAILCIKNAKEANNSSLAGFYLNNLPLILNDLPLEKMDAMIFILENVFDCNETSMERIFKIFEVVGYIFASDHPLKNKLYKNNRAK